MKNFAQNFNAFAPPAGTIKAVAKYAGSILRYGARDQQAVLESYGDFFAVPAHCIAQGAGASALLHTLTDFLPTTSTTVFSPSFWEYASFSQRLDKPVQTIMLQEEEDFRYDLSRVSETVKNQPTTLFICNPNNPTGSVAMNQQTTELAEQNPQTQIVIDETYLLFREDYPALSATKAATQIPNLHVVTSLSKFFAVPGLRLGTFISDPPTIERFRAQQPPYTVSSLSEEVMQWLTRQKQFIHDSRQQNTEARLALHSNLQTQFEGQLKLITPQTNFMFAKNLSAESDITDYLTNHDITVRRGREFGENFTNWFRFSIQSAAQNNSLTNALSDYFKQIKFD